MSRKAEMMMKDGRLNCDSSLLSPGLHKQRANQNAFNSYRAYKNPDFTNDGDSDHNTTITLVSNSKAAGRTNSTLEKNENNHFSTQMPSMSEDTTTTFRRDTAEGKLATSSFRDSPLRADCVMTYVDNLQIISTNVGATTPAENNTQSRPQNAPKAVSTSHKKQKISQSYIDSSKQDYHDSLRKQKATIFEQIVDKKTNKLINSLNS